MATLAQLVAAQKADPQTFKGLTPAQRTAVKAALQPVDGFTDDQRYWLSCWWLQCTQADVDAINAALPAGTQVAPLSLGGLLYLGSDLLTDLVTYSKVKTVLQGMTPTYLDPAAIQAAQQKTLP